MAQHVHDETGTGEDHLNRWDAVRMSRHLKDAHGFIAPMSWDLGRMHLHHLEDHQGPGPRPKPEQTCGAYYGVGDGTSTTCQRPAEHPPVSEDGIGHAPSHIPIIPKPEEAPMPDPIQTCGAVNPEYGYLICDYQADHDSIVDPVIETGDPTGDPWKTLAGHFDHGNQEKAVWWVEESQVSAVSTDSTEVKDSPKPEHPQILVDRLIAAMVGMDFEQDWASDGGMGPGTRGAFRQVYAEPAKRLMQWLERGGVMHLPVVAGMATDLEQAIGERDTARRQLAQEKEHTAGLTLQARQLVEDRADAIEARDRAQESLMAKLAETAQLREQAERAAELVTQLSLLSGDLEAITTDRDQARNQLANVIHQRDNLAVELIAAEEQSSGIGIKCTEAHLGLASTRELLEELTTRIDVGHAGLDYRTVDHH